MTENRTRGTVLTDDDIERLRPRRWYVIWDVSEGAINYENEDKVGNALSRADAERIAIEVVRGGGSCAVVQRMPGGMIMAILDREEVDNIT